jgi:hypothetical protein
MELAHLAGETISCLTLHQLDPNCVEQAKRFIQNHRGYWIDLPPRTGAKFFIKFPPGTRILPDKRWSLAGEWRYHIFLPDGAYLQALSRYLAGQEHLSNTIILAPDELIFLAPRPPLPAHMSLSSC